MALFADEGSESDGGGVASSFGIRELVWRPGMTYVFYLGGAIAVMGAVTMVALLWYDHGRAALVTW